MKDSNNSEVNNWLREGRESGATHVIIVCDTFDYENYPVNVMPSDNLGEKIEKYDGKDMQKIMEVYNISSKNNICIRPHNVNKGLSNVLHNVIDAYGKRISRI